MSRENHILRDLRTPPDGTAWAIRAAALRHGHLGDSYHLRAWQALAEARGMRFDARRVRAEAMARQQRLRDGLHHFSEGDCA